MTTSDFAGKSITKWLPLYRVENVLTNSNYIVRKVNSNHTQCVNRMRLRPISPKYEIIDLPNVDSKNFVPDPSTQRMSEPEITDSVLDQMIVYEPIVGYPAIPGHTVVFGFQCPNRAAAPIAPPVAVAPAVQPAAELPAVELNEPAAAEIQNQNPNFHAQFLPQPDDPDAFIVEGTTAPDEPLQTDVIDVGANIFIDPPCSNFTSSTNTTEKETTPFALFTTK